MLLVLCCVLGVRLFPAHASNHALEILAEVRGRGAVALDENPLTMLSEPGPALDSNLETACRRGCGYPCVLAASLRTATPTARVDAPSGATRNCSLGCSSTGRRLPPRLIIIGAQKGGTTELFATLREHDEFAAHSVRDWRHVGPEGHVAACTVALHLRAVHKHTAKEAAGGKVQQGAPLHGHADSASIDSHTAPAKHTPFPHGSGYAGPP